MIWARGLRRTPPALACGSEMRKTNPISPWRTGRGGEKRLTASLQACETNPIWPGPRARAEGQMRKTNPIWSGGDSLEVKRAKRTQFRPGGQGDGGEKRLTASLQTCKTKPNLGGLGYVGKGGCRAGVAPPGSETCETNPICPTGSGRFEIRSKFKWRMTQTAEEVGRGRPTHEEPKRAKRTQSRPGGVRKAQKEGRAFRSSQLGTSQPVASKEVVGTAHPTHLNLSLITCHLSL
jgi:hypothetical protein